MSDFDYRIKIAAAVILPNVGSYFNGRITRNNLKPWFRSLRKPSFNPPDYVFAPVWTSLYAGMGYASYLVCRDAGGIWNDRSRTAMLLYGGQLALNWAWTPIFFKYHSTKWSFVNLTVLTATAATCGYAFYQINTAAGWLFAPYLAWLSYATLLNYSIYKLNPDGHGVEEGRLTDVSDDDTASKDQ